MKYLIAFILIIPMLTGCTYKAHSEKRLGNPQLPSKIISQEIITSMRQVLNDDDQECIYDYSIDVVKATQLKRIADSLERLEVIIAQAARIYEKDERRRGR